MSHRQQLPLQKPRSSSRRAGPSGRRAAIALEALMSFGILLLLIAAVSQLLGFAAQQRRRSTLRDRAWLYAENTLDANMTTPWRLLEKSEQAGASPLAQLPGGEVRTKLTNDQGAVRIAVRVSWNPGGPGPREQVELFAWRDRARSDR